MTTAGADLRENGPVSQGETYEQWLERTGSGQPKPSTDARLWDLLIIVLLGVYFLWVGGSSALIGLGLVAVLAAEQVMRFLAVRSEGVAVLGSRRIVTTRAAALLVTLVLGAWFGVVEGGEAFLLPLVLVLDDLKNNRSFLRWAFRDLITGLITGPITGLTSRAGRSRSPHPERSGRRERRARSREG